MANKFRGEAQLAFTRMVDDKEEPVNLKLVFDANALCEVEEQTGLDMGGFLEQLSNPRKLSFRMVRSFVWGGLQRTVPDITVQQAGDIISDAGLEAVVEAMTAAVEGAMPKKAKPGK